MYKIGIIIASLFLMTGFKYDPTQPSYAGVIDGSGQTVGTDIVLSAIIVDSKRNKIAIINDKTYRINDIVSGKTIENIAENYIEVKSASGSEVINLLNGVTQKND